jgi:capsular polysaccharide biosynthesis protein
MLIRISLIVAIVAALAAGTLNIFQVRGKINTLISQRDDEHKNRVAAETDRDNTKKELAKTKDVLTRTQQELTDTKTQRDKAVAEADIQIKRANDLSDKLAKKTQELNDSQAQLAAYVATSLTPDQVMLLNKTLKNTQTALDVAKEENIILQRTVGRLNNQLAAFVGTNYVVKLRANLKGKIVAVDPKWDFVVLNIGEDQGVLEDGEMLVSRDGKLVAKVIVRSIQKGHSIANVVPGWRLGDMVEGDEVTPAHPAS